MYDRNSGFHQGLTSPQVSSLLILIFYFSGHLTYEAKNDATIQQLR